MDAGESHLLGLCAAGLGPGSIHLCLVPAGLQGPPVCGAHGPGLLPAEQPSLLQAVPREAECCGVLLRAPPGQGLQLHTSPTCRGPSLTCVPSRPVLACFPSKPHTGTSLQLCPSLQPLSPSLLPAQRTLQTLSGSDSPLGTRRLSYCEHHARGSHLHRSGPS